MTGRQRAVVVALLGPTASGKTAAALEVARRQAVEIVSIDSALVYRGMDIGTAKPSVAERQAVPHHLIDLCEPTEAYSAARFVADAGAAIDAILARERLPLLVGGTMLYYRSLRFGLAALPAADAAIRARIEDEARRVGWPLLHARLAALDPTTAARLSPNDGQRIQRALEVIEVTGTPMSDVMAGDSAAVDLPWDLRAISLEPPVTDARTHTRSELNARIATRFDAMLSQGLLDEVERLRARGDLHPDLPSMRAVGYRQAWEYLDGAYGQGAGALDDLRERSISATRQLAKRQMTWLRKLPVDLRIDCHADDAAARVARQVHDWTGG
ncbi:tRNA (adenosine(37)-N6)-dimethylallyltransferase MiaA [soil metagenome]